MTDTGAFNEIGREAVRLRLAEYPREMRLTAQVWLLEQDAIVAAQRRKFRLRFGALLEALLACSRCLRSERLCIDKTG